MSTSEVDGRKCQSSVKSLSHRDHIFSASQNFLVSSLTLVLTEQLRSYRKIKRKILRTSLLFLVFLRVIWIELNKYVVLLVQITIQQDLIGRTIIVNLSLFLVISLNNEVFLIWY